MPLIAATGASGETITITSTSTKKTRSRSSGVVLVITLLAIVLLAALLLWVINLGQQVDHRVNAQNGADATARAGAGWTARTMNMIALNNVEMTRDIAAVNVMSAMPQAADFQLRESQAFRDALAAQIQRGIGPGNAVMVQTVLGLLQQMLGEFDTEITDMTPVDQFFKSYDVTVMTDYKKNGTLWQAMTAMDEMNAALVESLGDGAQSAGVFGSKPNIPATTIGDAANVLLPLNPSIPAKRGKFLDFERPVRRGILPIDQDDRQYNRGPWDAVFGWHEMVGKNTGGTFVPGAQNVVGAGQNKTIGLTRGPGVGDNGHMVGQTFVPTNYVTWGPQTWMDRMVTDYRIAKLRLTRFDWYERNLARYKMSLVFPNALEVDLPAGIDPALAAPQIQRLGRGLSTVYNPDWRTDFPKAVAIADAKTPTIRETAFFIVEIKSKYKEDEAGFMTPGTWAVVENGGEFSPRLAIERGWVDPRRWTAPMTANYVWRDKWDYTVLWDNTIGITPQFITVTNPDGTTTQTPVPQPVYRIDHVAFAGINVGDPSNITNPYDGFDPAAAASPAPMQLDQAALPRTDMDKRFAQLSFLGVTRLTDKPQGWPSHFQGGRPEASVLAVAQARVFNNHSWDLWTPMWRAQLEPVSHYDDWITAAGGNSASNVVDAAEVAKTQQYLTSAKALAAVMLQH